MKKMMAKMAMTDMAEVPMAEALATGTLEAGAPATEAATPKTIATDTTDTTGATEHRDPAARYVLAFDTANEVIAIGLGRLECPETLAHKSTSCSVSCNIECVAHFEQAARRASNTKLLPSIDELLKREGIARSQIACVVCGRGPGSFTGVRIAMATAKGIAQALPAAPLSGAREDLAHAACERVVRTTGEDTERATRVHPARSTGVPLIGVSSLDAVAWNAWAQGVRGNLAVVADAMRHEVYPVRFLLSDAGVERLQPDSVMKAEAAAEALTGESSAENALLIAGDALTKYAELFEPAGAFLDSKMWTPTGRGLLLAAQAAWRAGVADPFDFDRHNPAFALPVYTRLSDAEENERARLARADARDLHTGVQGADAAPECAIEDIIFRPLDANCIKQVAEIEREVMGSSAWGETLLAQDIAQRNRTWWVCGTRIARDGAPIPGALAESHIHVLGYAGGMMVDGELEILKVAVVPHARRRGLARALLARVAEDARNLGASTVSLEVRAGNEPAQALYHALGMEDIGMRPRYYQDGEDALFMRGPIARWIDRGVAGMALQNHACAMDKDARTQSASAQLTAQPAATQPASAQLTAQLATTQPVAVQPATTQPASAQSASPAPLESAAARPLIFAIESSCDETAAAIVDGTGTLLSDVVASQIDFHARFGGVVPEIASRKHIEAICGVCDECFDVAAARLGVPALSWSDMDAVSVTYAPGLVGALVVGVAFAKGAAWAADIPFIGANHLEGHLYANKLAAGDFAPPAVVSLVSGGNTMLVHMRDWGNYETLGATIDDAVGEAFDKVAKALGLGYPGGPAISRLAAQGDPAAIPFPRAMMHSGDLRFSLSGLKTAVITYIEDERAHGRELNLPDIAASFQQAVIDVQVAKARTALEQTGAPQFCLGGGVAANPALRAAYDELACATGVRLVMPPLASCGDNAGMIALVALDRFRAGRFFTLDADAHAHANLDEEY